MRLHEIKESAYHDIEDVSQILEKYKPIIDKYFKEKKFIYRGMRDTSRVILGDGNKLNRKSANTKNYYTLLMDYILPTWKEYPKRSKSFICSTDTVYPSNNFGDLFIVIPLENQPIAMCPKSDLWNSFDLLHKMNSDASNVNYTLEIISRNFGIKLNDENPTTFLKQIKQLDNLISQFDVNTVNTIYKDDYNLVVDYIYKNVIMKSFENIYDPNKNGFELFNSYEKFKPKRNREVWLSGKVLFIHEDFVELEMGKKIASK